MSGPVEEWGADLYGDPCAECGFEWSLGPWEAVRVVEELPVRFAQVLAGCTGRERCAESVWGPAAYVGHVGDDLRIWAERLAGAWLSGEVEVGGYDPDLLARARGYEGLALSGALWSLERAVADWRESAVSALRAGVVLRHAARGARRAVDVVLDNAHHGHHHVRDVGRVVGRDVPPGRARGRAVGR
ncbi:hypothetical protein [Nocardiopsis sp. NRRL B-16309]|uniref:hypothetical protein n=1 Tax=Nocardiopsis sp. NRRL B-16309 TaxID=1519494 RepID=UPI0006AFFB84|nr:hypothetical protein [Nocardiopsis sp. NRRL B-16309]KOX12379.1 hypothetical protein ADL05_20825 [Nocardiopsis sp. NRRL B-16309]